MEVVTPVTIFQNALLSGAEVVRSVKLLSQLKGVFEDEAAFEKMDGDQVVYEVDAWLPVAEGTEGGLFFGLTHLYPGTVGDEYFMTRGHVHAVENRAEYYWGLEGEGLLLLMDSNRHTRAERMFPGSLHYIPGYTAHRVVNTGDSVLRFGACWPSDAGHNYEVIDKNGFSRRVKSSDNEPVLL
ncbi:glucose-6-phosphate isomerase family protein [Botryobacter ruber]|uniref:glucose-6-phosphate isomerase family protein n=1 Tax=Botryobacter ruber TaxID=2171629 RepID=UPI000E0C0C19|nr:glucose-6-phosphate isomerase family protein [Botryobacter ruber]